MGTADLAPLQAAELVRDIMREFLEPPRSMGCTAWADEFRYIAKGPEKGRWRTARTPYLLEPMNCTDPENPVQKVVMQFATQLGKSEVLYNALFKRIHLDPIDMMMVQPTLQDSKDHSRQRFAPTARQMPDVAARMPDMRSRDETNTWQTKEIRGGATLFFAGANSARSLASKPLGFAVCDEIDGYPLDVDGEGDPIALVWERMSNFPTRKLLLCSTPTLRDFSRIESEYNASDRRRYWVPCPHCGETQLLVWGADSEHGIKWLKTETGAARAETAVYICMHCAAAIEERSKTQMLHDGQWRPDMPGAQRGLVAGFHLNKLHSPNGWKSWAMLVEDFVKAQDAARSGDVSRLKTFINTSLAETWEEQGDRIAAHELQRRAAAIPLRTVHWGMYVCTLGVDTQGDRLEAYVWAWGRGMERQLVDRQVFYGDPSLAENDPGSPWAALTEYRRTPILHASGRASPILAGFIDSGGHHTQAVYSYCRAHQHAHVYAIKGASISGKTILGKPSEQDVNWLGNRVKRGVKLWPIGTDTAKAEIYGRLRISEPGPGYVHISRNFPADVFEQLTSERLVTRYIKGHARLEWIKPNGKRNEALDCAVYALAAAIYVGIDRWKEGDWSKWEVRVAERDLFDQAVVAGTAEPIRVREAPAAPESAADVPAPAPAFNLAPLIPQRPPQRAGRQW
jgi:phage terminase large subunit GpA-like protein